MSFSHDDVRTQVQEVRRIVRGFDGCDVLDHRVTNKRMIVMCTGRNVANTLLANLKHNGYPIVTAAAALKSTNYYVEVRFNYPY